MSLEQWWNYDQNEVRKKSWRNTEPVSLHEIMFRREELLIFYFILFLFVVMLFSFYLLMPQSGFSPRMVLENFFFLFSWVRKIVYDNVLRDED
jgi:hypothetical protein